jgi:glycosyltransferase involved in cell wall biosynthesis
MKTLILIPSYKRQEVLNLTLKSLFAVHKPSWEITVCVGDNQSTPETLGIILHYNVKYKYSSQNLGKAEMLNRLLRDFDGDYDVIVTMDNDMVLLKPWYHILDGFLRTSHDFCGVAAEKWWWHVPLDRAECDSWETNEPDNILREHVQFYNPVGIAGGLLLFRPEFLRAHPWTNQGGVYGAEDGLMCQTTRNRAVIYWDEDWLQHDPLSSAPDVPESLRTYQEKKRILNEAGTMIFPEHWDE